MQILLDIADNKVELFLEFIKDLSFIKKSEKISANQITNSQILQSIEGYESGRIKPSPLSLTELKAMAHA